MKIEYLSTIDEEIDAQKRFLGTLKKVRKWKINGFILAPLLFVGYYLSIPDRPIVKLIGAFLGSALFAIIYFVSYNIVINKRAKKFIVEMFGRDKTILSEYELNEEGLIHKRKNAQIQHNWNSINGINETNKDVEFIIGQGGSIIVPNRIFSNTNQREEWLKFARNKLEII